MNEPKPVELVEKTPEEIAAEEANAKRLDFLRDRCRGYLEQSAKDGMMSKMKLQTAGELAQEMCAAVTDLNHENFAECREFVAEWLDEVARERRE